MTRTRAIAHKDYDVRGGGEVLAEELARTFDAPLYVGSADINKIATETGIAVTEIFPKWWQQLLVSRGGLLRSAAYRYLWQQDTDELHEYDTVILSGNEPLWYVGPDEQTTVAYTHSTPRWMYDLFPSIDSTALGRVWQAVLEQQRIWYHPHTRKPDRYVANSDLVARRIQKYWNIPDRQLDVVYPPIDVDSYAPDHQSTGDYYVTVSRLCGPKRIDWLIDRANELDLPLKVAGTGPMEEELREAAGPTVDMLGYVSEAEKRELLAGARAFIMTAQNEDFGITPIEAMASGTPVLTVADGFSKYQVTDGETGYTFAFTAGAFADTITRFEADGVRLDEPGIAAFADHFRPERFRKEMRAAVRRAETDSEIEPSFDSSGIDDDSIADRVPAATDGGDSG